MERPRTSQFLAYALILTLVGSVISLAIPTFQPSYASHNNISVEIDHDIDEPYGQSDDVVISGSIDQVEPDEDHVTIKVKRPGSTGTTWTTDKTLTPTLDDNGNFDDSYAVSGSALDGVYAVEVDYNNEKVYSYFIVDEDSDTVFVETDDTLYSGGDDVVVSGQVDTVVSGEEDVLITIVDPTNGKILDEEPATLGEGSLANDKFEFTFTDLASDADHGRYGVIVNYDNEDQQGFVLFEVEDPDAGGSDNISADMSDDTYAPGDTVSLSGTIDTKHSGTDLKIVVKDPSNHVVSAYGDNSVTVATNGDFDYDFDLADDADEGKYTVTLTYGSDDLKLDFTVDADASSSTTSKLTVKLNKASFLAGESITVTGTVPKIVNDEEVNVLAYDKDSVFTGSAAYVAPTSAKTYTATLKLKSDLKVQDGYQVRVDYNGEEVKATFSITGQTDVLTVKTDKPRYDIGSTVKITGQVASGAIVSGIKAVTLQVFNPDDAAYRIDPVDVASDGSFSYSLVVGGDLGIPGTYDVKVTYNGKQVKTTFDLGSSATTYGLKAGSKTYQIQYGISSGSIKSMFVQTNDKKLVVAVDATDDGQLTLMLPREVIDAIQNGKDIPFVVATTDIEAGAGGNANIDESSTNGDTRTVVIDYKKGTDLIEISGTSVVPEFGAISAIVLAIAIVGIIMATARFGNKFNLMRQ
jgi:predicted secreted protein with PEFG-CTERM motif